MKIRGKIIFVVLPLIVAPLLITGLVSSLAARNGITAVASEFLQFKLEGLIDYADSQWSLVMENDFSDQDRFVSAAKSAIDSFARNLIRRESELIFAVTEERAIPLSTSPLELSPQEWGALEPLLTAEGALWEVVTVGGIPRVGQMRYFEPFEWYIWVTEEQSVFLAPVRQIVELSTVILGVSLILSVALLIFFAGYLTRPLRNIVGAMKDIIRTDDLTRRVDVLYADETGELGHTFNIMTSELDRAYGKIKGFALKAVIAQNREEKIRNIFQRYVPKDVIDAFFINPEGMLVGQDRILALLFSDVRGFTGISEQMLPHEVVECLNTYFGMMVDIITRRNGIVDKYIGDAIMAFYGAPVRRKDEAEQAVYSAFEMLDALEDFNDWQRRRSRPEFKIGIGINYGVVTVGNIGSQKKMDYTVIGDMVNVASRLEGLTKSYDEPLLVSESVMKYVENKVPCRLVDRVIVKGKTTGTGIYAPKDDLSPREEQAWKIYHAALDLYYQRQFDGAAQRLRKVRELLPDDRPSAIFLKRCLAYQEQPPEEAWTGAVSMLTK